MRAFAAIPFGEEEREILESLQRSLAAMPALADFRWARAGGVHLTLRFLGEIEKARAEAAAEALRLAGKDAPAFEVPLERFGVFPHLKRPGALWAGPQEAPAPLAALEARLSRHLAEAGFPAEDRPFRPHMTLARRRSRDRPPAGLEGELEVAERRWLSPPPLLRARGRPSPERAGPRRRGSYHPGEGRAGVRGAAFLRERRAFHMSSLSENPGNARISPPISMEKCFFAGIFAFYT